MNRPCPRHPECTPKCRPPVLRFAGQCPDHAEMSPGRRRPPNPVARALYCLASRAAIAYPGRADTIRCTEVIPVEGAANGRPTWRKAHER